MAKKRDDGEKVPVQKSAEVAERKGRSRKSKDSPLGRKGWGYDPLLGLESIKTTMSEMLTDLFSKKGNWSADLPWEPPLDIYEAGNQLVVEVLLPGVQKKDIQIHATRDLLIISGETRERGSIEEDKFHVQERRFGNFSRSSPLPFEVDPEDIKAELKDGVLMVTLPVKGPQIKKYNIPIE